MKTIVVRILVGSLIIAMNGASVRAQEAQAVKLSATDTNGSAINVPDGQKPVILAFVRAEQDQSKEALKAIKAGLSSHKAPLAVRVIAIVSGNQAMEQAKALDHSGDCPGPVVADEKYDLSGKLGIHVWPTTVVVGADGKQLAHLAGMTASFATDLSTYLDYADGKIDQAGVQQRLTTRQVIGESSEGTVGRYILLAQRLLSSAEADKAKEELDEGLKKYPDDASLQVMMAKTLSYLHQPKEAMDLIDRIKPGAVPQWQIELVRGRAMMALDNWDKAKAVLPEALKLNPDPMETHYLLGLVYEREGDFKQAAEHYRAAFEGTAPGTIFATTRPQR